MNEETIAKMILMRLEAIQDEDTAKKCVDDYLYSLQLTPDERVKILDILAKKDPRLAPKGVQYRIEINPDMFNLNGYIYLGKPLMRECKDNKYRAELIIYKD
jgi:hypothetical protein